MDRPLVTFLTLSIHTKPPGPSDHLAMLSSMCLGQGSSEKVTEPLQLQRHGCGTNCPWTLKKLRPSLFLSLGSKLTFSLYPSQLPNPPAVAPSVTLYMSLVVIAVSVPVVIVSVDLSAYCCSSHIVIICLLIFILFYFIYITIMYSTLVSESCVKCAL